MRRAAVAAAAAAAGSVATWCQKVGEVVLV